VGSEMCIRDSFKGADELGVELDGHIQTVIDAMKGNAAALGLAGTTATATA